MKKLGDETERYELFMENTVNEIERFTDSLIIYFKWEPGQSLDMNICTDQFSKDFCSADPSNKRKRCVRLPGVNFESNIVDGKEENKIKNFIPQLYHILQDFGFFNYYLGLNTVNIPNCLKNKRLNFDITNLIPKDSREKEKNRLVSRWALFLGRILQIKSQELDKESFTDFVGILIKVIERVQFLRHFDEKCCVRDQIDDPHKAFNVVLGVIRDQLVEELESNEYYC